MNTPVDRGDGIACVCVGDVILVLWRDPATLDRVRWFSQRARAEAGKHPGGIVIIQVILGTSTPPGSEARTESMRLVTALREQMRRTVTLPAGDALWGSVVRAIMRAVFMVTGQSALQSVASTFDEALKLAREKATDETPRDPVIRAAMADLFGALAVPIPAGYE